ncbi:hypothetical protein EPK99_19275 [Neorhizobium lilium]|uniref:DUF945 domain-containing protein n=1 Tax=Neorhizobium lilium TaxID=2503024 RepID=A0A3S3REU3_9HYPH|nr:hypothetical protein [Neorhizobium lilium]RWX75824.1 hypothetical protein EPK99_19275 [Neorhizobium lilium]
MHCSIKARPLLAGVALTILAGPAFALDGNDLLAKVNKALAIQGGTIEAQSIAVNGDHVILTGTSFNPSGATERLPIGTVTLDGVKDDAGGYSIDKVTFPNFSTSKEGSTVSVSDITMSGVTVPGDASTGGFDSLLLYDEAHSGPMTVAVDGKTIFAVAETNVTTALSDDSSGLDFDLNLKGMKADLSVIDDPQTKEAVTALGLTSLDGKMTVSGNWTQNDGTVDIKEYSLDFAKVGRLNLAVSLSGYTLDFIRSAQETAKAMEANPDKQEAQQAANLAMLGLMQRLTFNSAQIRFEDDGITKRALDYAGKKQGTTGEQMAQMVKAMTPLMLAQYNIPELQNMLSSAVNTFLDKPGALTVDAEPANPVPFPMIMGAAMGAPNTLPKVLGVKVSAND